MNTSPQAPSATEESLSLPFRISLMGFAFMVASDLISIKGFNLAIADSAIYAEGMMFSRSVLTAFLIGGLVGSITCLCVAVRRMPRVVSWKALFRFGVIVFAVGIACVLAIDHIPGVPPYSGVAGGVLIGFGNAFLLILWGRVFSQLPLRQALAYAAVSLALGVTLSVLTLLVLENRGQAYVWIVYQACACLALVFELSTEKADSPVVSVAPATKTTLRKYLREAGVHTWMAFVGLGIFCFIFGIYWGHNLSMVFYDSFLEVVISWASAGLVLIIALQKRTSERFGALYSIAIPAASLLLLIDPFLAAIESGVDLASGVFLASSFIILGVVNWVAFSSTAAKRPELSDTLFSIDLACCCLTFSLGILLYSLVEFASLRMVTSVVVILFIIAIIVSHVVTNGARETTAGTSGEEWMEQKVQHMADRYALSKRETEVLLYLIQGRGAKFISEELCISQSTVQTHRKHIYKKLDVSSREELLDLAAELN